MKAYAVSFENLFVVILMFSTDQRGIVSFHRHSENGEKKYCPRTRLRERKKPPSIEAASPRARGGIMLTRLPPLQSRPRWPHRGLTLMRTASEATATAASAAAAAAAATQPRCCSRRRRNNRPSRQHRLEGRDHATRGQLPG